MAARWTGGLLAAMLLCAALAADNGGSSGNGAGSALDRVHATVLAAYGGGAAGHARRATVAGEMGGPRGSGRGPIHEGNINVSRTGAESDDDGVLVGSGAGEGVGGGGGEELSRGGGRGSLLGGEISSSASLRTRLTSRARTKVTAMQREGLTSCALRAHTDIADRVSTEVMDLARTGVLTLIIDGIVVLICIIVVIIVVIFLLATADESGSDTVKSFVMTVNPAVMSVVWPLMENEVTTNMLDEVTNALMNACAAKIRYRLTVSIANYLSDVVAKFLFAYIIDEELPVLAAGIAHRVLHAVVLDLTRSLTRSLTHTLPRYVRGVLGKSTVRLFYCVYCYREGQFCTYCFSWQSFGDPQKTKSVEPDLYMSVMPACTRRISCRRRLHLCGSSPLHFFPLILPSVTFLTLSLALLHM